MNSGELLLVLTKDNPEPSRSLSEGATTIPEGSTLQAIGSGSAGHPNK